MKPSRIGIQIGSTTSPRELPPIAAEAEGLGFGEIWLAEDYFESGGIASAATVLAATERVAVGLGVVAAVARHPAVTAMEFATLGTAFPSRFMAGIGHGVGAWVRQMGLTPDSPLRSLEAAVASIRRLLAGEELTLQDGDLSFDHVRLLHPPAEPVPIYLGVHGPKSLRLSGELADGTLLGWFSSPGYVAWARERIDEGRMRAGRTDPHELVALCVLSVSDPEPDIARHKVASWAAPLLARMASSPQMKSSPEGADLLAIFERAGAVEAGPDALPSDLLKRFVAAGDTSDVAATIAALLDAGADRVVLVPNPAGLRTSAEMVDQMRTAAALTGTDAFGVSAW